MSTCVKDTIWVYLHAMCVKGRIWVYLHADCLLMDVHVALKKCNHGTLRFIGD
jgi:hypothetical protein